MGAPQPAAVLRRADGAPDASPDVAVSISHKRPLAVALAGPAGAGRGIDVERVRAARGALARRVVRDDERAAFDALVDIEEPYKAALFFSRSRGVPFFGGSPWSGLGRFVGRPGLMWASIALVWLGALRVAESRLRTCSPLM